VGGPADANERTCHVQKLTPVPSWVSSGVFNRDVLLLADPWQGRLYSYAEDGRLLDAVPPRLRQSLQDVRPQVISQERDRLYLEILQSRIVTLGADYSYKDKQTIEATQAKGGMKLAGMFLWQPVGSDLLTFSDVQMPNEDWWGAFVRFPANDPTAFSVLRWVPLRDSVRTFNRLGHPYIAAVGEDGYVLLMDNDPGIYRSRKGKKDLEPIGSLSGILGRSPILPLFGTRRDVAQVMTKVEQSRMPTGMYGWNGFLYVVMRQPAKGGTRWSIHKINPEGKGEVVGSAQIPTRANHLTVVPGPTNWAFIEKGPVEAWGRQRVGKVLFVPSARLEGEMPGSLCSQREISP
jgi:hypothetical protein